MVATPSMSTIAQLNKVITSEKVEEGEKTAQKPKYQIDVLQGADIMDFFMSQPQKLGELMLLYARTFGDSPWNEYAKLDINRLKNEKDLPFGLKRTVGIEEFRRLPYDQVKYYEPFYNSRLLRGRLIDQFRSDELAKPFILTLKDEKGFLIGATWGVTTNLEHILSRIQQADYKGDEGGWIEISKSIKNSLRKSPIANNETYTYIDEVFIHPAYHGRGLGSILFNNLFRYLINNCVIKGGLPIIFRTSKNSTMGKISQSFVKKGILNELWKPIDDPGVIDPIRFYGGVVNWKLILLLRFRQNFLSVGEIIKSADRIRSFIES